MDKQDMTTRFSNLFLVGCNRKSPPTLLRFATDYFR